MEEILDVLAEQTDHIAPIYHSSVYQAERIELNSFQDVNRNTRLPATQRRLQPCEFYNTFRIRLKNPLLRVKGIQLLSAILPNPNVSIPPSQLTFLYYRLPEMSTMPVWNNTVVYNKYDVVLYSGTYYVAKAGVSAGQAPPNSNTFNWELLGVQTALDNQPNYFYLINGEGLQYVYLKDTLHNLLSRTDTTLNTNRIFTDYQDLVNALNYSCANAPYASIPNDIEFQVDPTTNLLRFVPNHILTSFYIPVGFEDTIAQAYVAANNPFQNGTAQDPNYLLNQRLGFTWNGVIDFPNDYGDMFQSQEFFESIDPYLCPNPFSHINLAYIVFNAPPNLCNTSSVHIYSDIPLGSSQSSVKGGGLLSVIPMNAAQYGVCYYQNNFDRPLTKIPDMIHEIFIELRTDNDEPFWLPYSACVILELGIKY